MINEKRMMIEALNIANDEVSDHRKIMTAKKRIFNDMGLKASETFKGEVGTDIFADLLLESLYCFKNTAVEHKLSYLVSRVSSQLEAEVAWARLCNQMPDKESSKHLVNFVRTLNESYAKNLKLNTNTKFNLIKLLNKVDPSKLSSKHPLRKVLRAKAWNAFGDGVAKDIMTVRGILFAALLTFFEKHPHFESKVNGHGSYIVTKTVNVNVEVFNYMFKTPRNLSDVHAFKFDLTPSIQRQSISVALASSFTFNEDYTKAVQEVIKSKEHWNYFNAENEEALTAKVESVEADVENGLRFWNDLGKGNVYFNYVIDFRGRISQLGGISAVGHKVGKAMLRSGVKQRLGEHGFKHILLNLAGSMGHDKMTFADRLVWANDNLDSYITIGELVINEPVKAFQELDTLGADDIFAAASIALELYYISKFEGQLEDFESNLFVGYDATCSGLQIVSLLWGNKMLAENTNVAKFEGTEDKIYDIYKYLYEAMDKIVWDGFKTDVDNSEELLQIWDALEPKTKRGIAKKLLMPRIYGSTFQTWSDNTRKEAGKKDIFKYVEDKEAREKMTFNFGTVIAKLFQTTFDNESGFQAFRDFDSVVGQVATAYNSKKKDTVWTLHESSTFDNHVIKSVYRLNATARYRAYHSGQMVLATSYGVSIFEEQLQKVSKINVKKADTRKAKNAISPNFVHSFDALLLHTVNYTMKSSMRLTHDCFACTAGQAERMLETINNTFVDLFGGRNNIIKKLVEEAHENTGVEITVPGTLSDTGISINNIEAGIYKFS